jgi:hypothetical protein
MMEAERLSWVRNNQSTLRVGKYQKLNHNQGDEPKTGKRVVLPSSFVGSKRYMDQLYFDGMAISANVGFPDLFITFTCNPNWPEIQRLLGKLNLKAHDRADIVARVFKIKLNELMNDLTKKHVLGKVVARKYKNLSFIILNILVTYNISPNLISLQPFVFYQICIPLNFRKGVYLMLIFCFSFIHHASILHQMI